MTDERRVQIEQTIADLEARGIAWTNQLVYGTVGGQYGELAEYLKERRASTSGTSASTSETPASTSEIPVSTSETPASTSETPAAVAVLEPPAAVGEPVPPPPKPTLTAARERAQACVRAAAPAERAARAMADQISQAHTRVQELTAVRRAVESVDALRALKAEVVALEEQLEVWTIQHTALAHTAQTQREAAARARQSYEQLRLQAIMTLQNARPTANEGYLPPDHARLVAHDRARSVRELTALIGAEAVDTYLTSGSRGESLSRVPPPPPWVYRSEIP